MSPAAELTHQRLIRAASSCSAAEAITNDDRADREEGRLAEGTIYRHFPSKQQLLNELYRAALRWAAKTVEDSGGAAPRPGSRSWPKGSSKARSAILPL